MAVYVDNVAHRYRGMLMCHLWSPCLGELLRMVDAIDVDRKWIQAPPKASWIHFDISKGRKARAIAAGAILTDRYGPVEHVARMNGDTKKLQQIEAIRARRRASSPPGTG